VLAWVFDFVRMSVELIGALERRHLQSQPPPLEWVDLTHSGRVMIDGSNTLG
jgi:hypothetical protein